MHMTHYPAIALYQPDIAQNMGTLVRLGACMGTKTHIIEPCGFALDDKKLRRAGMDYMELASITRHASWEDFKHYVADQQHRVVLLTTKTTTSYMETNFQPHDILLVGRESAGVPESVHHSVDMRVTIPMQPPARSLNVAISAAMVFGEALRQTQTLTTTGE